MRRLILPIILCVFLVFPGWEVYGQSCTTCDSTITVSDTESGTFNPPENANVCITGSGVFDGTINLEGTSTLCIDTDVTYEYSADDMWEGSWTVENHGTFKNSKEMEIQSGQTFNNYGHFEIVLLEAATDNELVIRDGGRLYNEGSVYVSGDIINFGELESTGTIELDNEFKNMSTGFADVTSVIGKGDMTNDGTINLRGIIESLEGAFYNTLSGTIFGFGDPCSYIKAATEVENKGMLDGTNGAIVLDSGVQEYDKSGGEEPEIIWNDGTTEHECLRILPVDWLDLSATFFQNERRIRIDWSTTKEWENGHFEIERSVGSIDQFKLIGRIEGMGWTSSWSHYEFEDAQLPLNGAWIYYRIKQVDLDGTFTYSKVLSIKLPQAMVKDGVWKVYPNPIQGKKISIDLINENAYGGETLSIRLSNTMHTTKFFKVNAREDLNLAIENALRTFPTGLIVLEIHWGNQVEFIKMIYSD